MGELGGIANEAVQIGIEEVSKEATEMLIPSIEEVKQAASDFYKAYIDSEAMINSEGFKNSKSRNRATQIKMFKDGVREKFDIFQNKINAYFGQLVKVMYVYIGPGGKVTLSALDNSVENLQLHSKYKDPRYVLNELQNQFKTEDYDSTLLDATEQSIYERWDIARSKIRRSQYLPIMWYVGGWQAAFVTNLGTVAEAYVNFYLSKYKFSGNLEADVGTYIIDGCGAVDNASGFLKGDVKSEIGEAELVNGKSRTVQWAVKKENASPMNMKKVKDVLDEMLTGDSIFNPEALYETFVTNEQGTASQMKPILEGALENTVDKLQGEYFKRGVISKEITAFRG